MSFIGRLELLTRKQVEMVHEASLEILEKTGVYFNCQEALELFKAHGARVEGKMVHFPATLVEAALRECPSLYRLEARNPKYTMEHGIGQKNDLLVSACYGSPFVSENGEKRLGTTEDYIKFTKLVQACPDVTFTGGILTDMSDVKAEQKEIRMLYQALLHSDKQILSFTAARENIRHMFRMIEIAFDAGEDLWNKPVAVVPICPTSPLKYEALATESLLEYAKKGQPVYIVNCLMAGVSSPITILGTAVQQNVEFLAGLVLTQLANPGNPVVYVPGSTTANLQCVCYANGSPEANLCNMVGLQMAYHYQLPNRVMSGITDSKVPDYQAGMETMQNHLLLVAAGAQCLHNGVGTLDSLVSMSYRKFVLDAEAVNRVNVIRRGIAFEEESLCMEDIMEVGPHGNHLTTDRTLDDYACRWQPAISYQDPLNKWVEAGKKDALTRAGELVEQLLASQPEEGVVEPAIARKLKAYVEGI